MINRRGAGRLGRVGFTPSRVLVGSFEADYFGTEDEEPRLTALAVTPRLLDDAARLVGTHCLRAYDGVQLASACAARDALEEDLIFVAFDKALCDAAAAEGLALPAEAVPPDQDPA